jgi:hypothetical protein
MYIKYTIIQSEYGEVGYPHRCYSIDEAEKYYNDCKGGAIFVIKVGTREVIHKHKGLSDKDIRCLMGWDEN